MSSVKPASPGDDLVTKLTAILDQHRERLESLPGVTGTGIGLSSFGDQELIVIKVFVDTKSREEELRERVTERLADNPFEIVYMPIPHAG